MVQIYYHKYYFPKIIQEILGETNNYKSIKPTEPEIRIHHLQTAQP